jgi:hypothetical protein
MDFVSLDGSSLKLSMQGCLFPWILQSWILNPSSNGQIIPIFQGQPDHLKTFIKVFFRTLHPQLQRWALLIFF